MYWHYLQRGALTAEGGAKRTLSFVGDIVQQNEDPSQSDTQWALDSAGSRRPGWHRVTFMELDNATQLLVVFTAKTF